MAWALALFFSFFSRLGGVAPQGRKKAEKQSQCQCHIPYICRVQNKICRVYTLQKRRTLHYAKVFDFRIRSIWPHRSQLLENAEIESCTVEEQYLVKQVVN